MTDVVEVRTAEPERWNAYVDAADHDIYHTADYHALAEFNGEGSARLLVAGSPDQFIALPVLLRKVPPIGGPNDLLDATSVYGYPGPMACRPTSELISRFRDGVQEWLLRHRVVSLFSRLNPLMDQSGLLAGIGELAEAGSTVSIDLTNGVEHQEALFRKNHRRDLRRLDQSGVETIHDQDWAYFEAWQATYRSTMDRVGAADYYQFGRDYFERLRALLGGRVHLFVAHHEGKLLGGGLFFREGGRIQYHLGSTADEALSQAPMKQVFDAVRKWGTATGADVFHLGGGVGGREDSLFRFKSGFSDRFHVFRTWRWITDPDAYLTLVRQLERTTGRTGLADSAYFPAYRAASLSQPLGVRKDS